MHVHGGKLGVISDASKSRLSISKDYDSSACASTTHPFYALPSQNCTTAHLPLHAHLRPPASVLPPSIFLSSSSLPAGSPTTTSALQVRSARTRTPERGPMGPMAWAKGVVGSHAACLR